MLGVNRPAAISVAVNNARPHPIRPKLALIAGPTASGKSALAMALAEAANGIVINADASQVYRDLRILTARPSPEDEARIPHRLFGHINAAEACSAARWAVDARAEIDAVHGAGKLPILVGGTGLYIRTLLDGIAPVPEIDPEVRAAIRQMPVSETHAALVREDPAAAARLAPADTARVARALEVIRSTARPIAEWQGAREGGIADRVTLAPLILLPDREALFARCDARAAAMLEGGAIDEVAALLARAIPADAPVRRAIGVPEIAALLSGDATLDETLAAIRRATRQYAKRQYTWFRRQPPAGWRRTPRISFDEEFVRETFLSPA